MRNKTEYLRKLNQFLLFAILLTVAYNIIFLMQYNFEDDAAFFVTLAQEQLRTRSLFPEGMYYSSGLFVLTPNLLIIPFLLVTDNLVLARQSAILLLWIFVYAVLYKVFITGTEKNIKGFILASSFFSVLYVNSNVVSMHFYQGAYITYLLFLLCFLALMNSIIAGSNYNEKNLAGIIFLYIIANLGDIRNLLIWGIPGFIAYGVFLFFETKGNFDLLKQQVEEKKLIQALFNGILLCFIIYVFIAKIFGNYGSTLSLTEISAKDYGESLNYILVGMFNLFGNSYETTLFSGGGVFKFINFLVAIFINFFIPVVAFKNIKNMELKSSRFLILFSLTSSLIYLLVVFLTGAAILLDRYLTPIYNNNILLFGVMGSFLLEKYFTNGRQKVIGIFGVLIYVLLSNFFYFYNQRDSLIHNKFGYFASGEEGVVDFLETKGLKYGYATYKNAEVYSVLSNNKVRVRCVAFIDGSIVPVKWLNSECFYKSDYYDGDSFLMLTNSELESDFPKGVTFLGQPKEVLEYKQFKVFVYDYNISGKFAEAKRGIWLIRGKKSAVYVIDE